MGDHFVLLMDRLLTESTLEAAIESSKQLMQAANSLDNDLELEKPAKALEFGDISIPGKLVECRICQDEDLDSNMVAPCSCSGSLKYAHRRCVQRWCNTKGNIVCEICHQQFKPNYEAPPPLFQIGQIPLNFRRNWEASGRHLPGARVTAMVSTDRALINASYDDQSSSSTGNLISCRLVAAVFMVLLILRHTIPFVLNGSSKDIAFPLLLLVQLRTVVVIIPICFMVMAVTAFQRRRRQQELQNPSSALPDEEPDDLPVPAQQHVIDID